MLKINFRDLTYPRPCTPDLLALTQLIYSYVKILFTLALSMMFDNPTFSQLTAVYGETDSARLTVLSTLAFIFQSILVR